ncbi:transposase [Glycomyces sp. A-F 0318]|uniref:transposase n=1 Tax=Glycomyces amatae TaxID=2881355 RepID=UPI001E4B6C25|nr:transposase [Glycomyces amatae]MCD0444236.1 transposase [Glycomyces amatae]
MPIRKYPPELKERAVRLCLESPERPLSQTADQLGINRETLRNWVRQAQRDAGTRSEGPTTAEKELIAKLQKENKELRKVNDILRTASAFFASEIDQTRR